MKVEFKKLPNFQKLFLDYVSPDETEFGKVRKFFNAGFRENEDFFKVIESKSRNYNANRYFDRNALIDILKTQNVSFGGNEHTAENIEKLKRGNTFAIVTGQQVGLYTGNLYTILKAASAVKLAANLKERFTDYDFVPVFWMESEDHDFEEANHVNIINRNNELVRIGYPELKPEEGEAARNAKPVGSIVFDGVIDELNEQLRLNLIETDFKNKLIEGIRGFYKSGNDFRHAFAQFMNSLFRGSGIVFIDPSEKEVKRLLSPIFERELTTSPKLCEAIIDTSAELEKEYDLQVKPKVINLFYIHNGNRYLIEPRENNRFALKNSKRRFEQEEMMQCLNESPWNFSPNVVLRPICQDYLLPTVAYVAGPAEISYFAQLKPAYEHYDTTMPVIYPRASVTFLEGRVTRFMKNFAVDFTEIFHHKILMGKVVEKLSEIKIDDEISKAQEDFSKTFHDLRGMISKIDRTLLGTLDNVREKLNTGLEILKDKLINAQAGKSDAAMKQIEKVTNNLYPHKNLQEREINVSYFLNKYDETLVEKLFNEMDVNCFEHQVIEI
jgi:bacillithiol biosynthesis cysteine-adding enzyme BshC